MRELIIEKFTEHKMTIDRVCGTIIKVWYNKLGQIHRNNNLPAITRENPLTGISKMYWYKKDKFIRDNNINDQIETQPQIRRIKYINL